MFGADAYHPLWIQYLCTHLGLGGSSQDHAHSAVLPTWVGDWNGSARHAQAGEHDRVPSPSQIFPGCALHCMADLAFTGIKKAYILHGATQG